MLNKKRMTLLTCLALLFSSITLATNKVEKLAEYNAFDFVTDVLYDSTVTFQGKPLLISFDLNESTDNLYLKTKKFVDNYSDVQETQYSLQNIVEPQTTYNLDVKNNDNTLYALLTNNDDNVREKKNLLLKSNDGQSWELYKSFPAEWELFDLDVNNNNISISCINCEDELKLSYIISTDQGQTWQKYSIPSTPDTNYFSGIANNRLFVVNEGRAAEDRTQLVHEILFKDLKNKKADWMKADISSVATLKTELNGTVVSLTFDDLKEIFSTEDYLIANASYTIEPNETEEEQIITRTLISNNNGQTWRLFNFNNLNTANEAIVQVKHHAGKYHLVSKKNISIPEFEDAENNGLDPFGLMMLFFKEQQYSYYTLSQDEMNKTEEFSLEPKIVLPNGIGFNLDYKHNHKSSYVDFTFIHNDNNDLKVEFYRLHD